MDKDAVMKKLGNITSRLYSPYCRVMIEDINSLLEELGMDVRVVKGDRNDNVLHVVAAISFRIQELMLRGEFSMNKAQELNQRTKDIIPSLVDEEYDKIFVDLVLASNSGQFQVGVPIEHEETKAKLRSEGFSIQGASSIRHPSSNVLCYIVSWGDA